MKGLVIGYLAVSLGVMLLVMAAVALRGRTVLLREKPPGWVQGIPIVLVSLFAAQTAGAMGWGFGTFSIEVGEAVVRGVGLLLVLAAQALALWGAYSLGRHLMFPVAVAEGHELIVSGAFRYVRHPIYCGFLGLWIGTGLALLSWSLLLTAGLAVPCYYARARAEEALFLRHFGARYREYRASVPMLFPWFRP